MTIRITFWFFFFFILKIEASRKKQEKLDEESLDEVYSHLVQNEDAEKIQPREGGVEPKDPLKAYQEKIEHNKKKVEKQEDKEKKNLLEKLVSLLKGREMTEQDETISIKKEGKKAIYKTVNPCNKEQPYVVTQEAGTVMSPGFFDGHYGDNIKCSWKFVAPEGKIVRVRFQIMDVEQSSQCKYDSVQVWDVRDGEGFRLAKYCGRSLPQELLESEGKYLFVYFLSDQSGGTGRFSFQWDFISPSPLEPSDVACGLPSIHPSIDLRIVNGVPAVPHSWPWQVSIRKVVEGRHYHVCGGSIISETVVLTAAHCFFDKYHHRIDDSSFRVVAGDYDQTSHRDGPTQSPSLKKIYTHRYYNPFSSSSPYDIAIITLKEALELNKHVATVCLPKEEPRIDDLCVATGWGDTKDTGDETILNQVRLPVVSQAVCRKPNHYGSQIVDSVLCAGYEEGGKDACQGDSGGPFVCQNRINGRWYLQGVTSWGAGCGLPLKPGIYTRIESFLDWIEIIAKVKS